VGVYDVFCIKHKKILGPALKLIKVYAPEIAAKAQPGQFIILRINEKGERIPLTIADFDRGEGLLTLIFQEVGRTTLELGQLEEGDYILDLVGPLGRPSHIENFGTVVCIGGGVGVAPIYPITRALKQAGNKIVSVIGARSGDFLILQEEMQAVSDQLYIATDDGSVGKKGFVTDILKEVIAVTSQIDMIMAIGPIPMMRAVAEMSRPYGIKTLVSMNPIMVDGTGMCGACRLTVGKETKFACVDGPEFDGHLVDWEVAVLRSKFFVKQEKEAMQSWSEERCKCRQTK